MDGLCTSVITRPPLPTFDVTLRFQKGEVSL